MQRMPQSLGDQFLMRRLGDSTISLYGGQIPAPRGEYAGRRNANPNPLYNDGKGYTPVGAVGFENTRRTLPG